LSPKLKKIKIMKKLVILLVAATFAFGIQSCSNSGKAPEETPVEEVIEEVVEEEVIEEVADSTTEVVEEVVEEEAGE
jgi:hypothetical protein